MKDHRTLNFSGLILGSALFAVVLTSCEPKVAPVDTVGVIDEGLDTIVAAKYKSGTPTNPANWGALNCHDPSIFRDDDGTYYSFSTDANIGDLAIRGIQVRTSTDLINWTASATSAIQGNWDNDMLAWLELSDSTATTWAPRVVKVNEKYLMYHGVMIDADSSKPRGWIGLAIADSPIGPYKPAATYDSSIYTTSTIVRYTWIADASDTVDDSACLNNSGYDTAAASAGTTEDWNKGFGAIDPDVVYDADGKLWLVYGSWKGGIAVMRLDNDTGMPLDPDTIGTATETPLGVPTDEVSGAFGTKIAGGGGAAYEGPQIFYRAPYYYLIMSTGMLSYDYSARLGRATSITGPYYDANGYDLSDVEYAVSTSGDGGAKDFHAHGNKLIGGHEFNGEYGWRSPGGPSVFQDGDGNYYLAVHTRTNFKAGYYFYLQIRSMFFTDDGWPVVNPNEYYNDGLTVLTESDIAGTYDAILSVRGNAYGDYTEYNGTVLTTVSANLADSVPTESDTITINADGSISGAYGGTWSLGSDGYTVTIELESSGGSALGTFKGVVLNAVDWARKDSGNGVIRKTISFTTTCTDTADAKCGEYFFGNKHNY